MSESGGEKTEAPTPKRKRKAADEGQILSSKDFGTALIVLLGCAWMAMLGPALIRACKEVMVGSFSFGRADIEDFEPWRPIAEAGGRLALPIGGRPLGGHAGLALCRSCQRETVARSMRELADQGVNGRQASGRAILYRDRLRQLRDACAASRCCARPRSPCC